tara:strand:- start:124 stop:915 length:792 start_codon:yes stop_codon:yes gene_type:complete
MTSNLYFIDKGTSSKTILLLHGLFGSSSNWLTVGARLADRYRVIIPDIRNHGNSPQSSQMSYEEMCEDIIELVDKLEISKFILLGHSMGGKIAMQIALTCPERIDGLGVVDMAPVKYAHHFDRIFRGFNSVDLKQLKNRDEADHQMSKNIPESDIRQFLLKNLIKTHSGWKWRLNLKSLDDNQNLITGFSPPKMKYKGPSWFLHGTKSDYLLPEHEPLIFKYFPRAQICPIKGASHWVHSEKPDLFWNCMERFLNACENIKFL